MAKLSLAVVLGSRAVRRSAQELFVCASETTSIQVPHHTQPFGSNERTAASDSLSTSSFVATATPTKVSNLSATTVHTSSGQMSGCAEVPPVGGRLGSTPRARMLNRAGRQLKAQHPQTSPFNKSTLPLAGVSLVTVSKDTQTQDNDHQEQSVIMLPEVTFGRAAPSSFKTEAIASLNPRARRSGLLWSQLVIVMIALLMPVVAAFAPSGSRVPLSPEQASAATSNQLNFQGRLLTNTGALVPDGVYNMQFDLYNVASGGSTLWTEDRLVTNTQGVSVQNGYYSVYLGQYDAFPAIDWSQDIYLGMTIRGTASCAWGSCTPADSEMTPRFKLTAVPYAFRASNVASSSTNAASTNSDGVSITTGNALGATSNSGNISVDVGTATGTAGTISLGSTNASALTIGRTGVATTLQGSVSLTGAGTALSVTNDATIGGVLQVNGNTTLGNSTSVDTLTVNAAATFNGNLTVAAGNTFTNAGSSLFTALSISDVAAGGNIGTAATTVDVATTFNVNQTTASQTLTLPSPTVTTSGRVVYVNNVGSTSFTMYGSVIGTAKSNAFIWNGTAWVTTVSLSGSVVNTIGTIDSQTKSADGAVIASNALYLQTADASFAGLVSTGTQTFAGAKTFNGLVTAAAGLTVSSGQNLTLSGVTSCVGLKTDGSGVVSCGANEFTYVVATSNSVNSATANYVGNGDTGAANDGDQVQINAAIAAADAAGGGTVYLLEGVYTIDDTILLENNVMLMGSGTETIIRSAADGGVADNFNMIENSDFTGGNNNITIRDLTIDGNRTNISASTRYTIDFEKVGSGSSSSAVTGFIIDNVHVINTPDDGIFAYDSRNSRITNSVVQNTGSGVAINMDTSDRIQISGNRIVGGSGIGTRFSAVTNSTISNNIYDGIGASGDNAITLRDGSNYNTIDGNTIQDTAGMAIEINGSSGSDSNVISNNNITGSTDEAIYLTLAFSTLITGNNLYDNEDTAGATDAQILVTGNADQNQIVGNFIQDSSGNQSYAINLSGSNVDDTYVADNYLLVTDGILNTADNTQYGNQGDGSGNLRIQAQSGSTINLLSNTDVTGTLTVSSTATFNGNTVIGNANTDTLTINAGTSGAGITLADSSFFSCTGLTTSASGVLTCSTAAYASTLQNAYDNDANGSDTVIALTSTDGALVLRDAASTIGTLFVVEANGGADYLSVASTGVSVGTGLTITSGNSLTLANNTSCVGLKTNGSGVVACGANENTYVVAASDSVNTATANYVADGTNDEAEIESAINAANAAGGGTVLLLEGTYNISTSIDLHDDVTLIGAGQEATILFVPNSTDSAFPVVLVSGDDNVRLSGFSIDGNNANNTTDNTDGVQIAGSSANTVIDHVTSRNNGEDGFDFGSSVRGQVVDSIADSNLARGVYVNSSDILIKNNEIRSNGNGSGSDGGVYTLANSTRVVGNHFDANNPGTSSATVILASGRSSLVGNNYFENTVSGPDVNVLADNSAISGNTFNNSPAVTIQVTAGVNGTAISGNAIYDAGTTAIAVSGSMTTITGNTIEVAGDDGIAVSSANQVTIIGNTINSPVDMGILISGGNYNTISNNAIWSANDDGISLATALQNIVTGNTVRSGEDIGIFADASSHYNTISNNQLYDNGLSTAADAIAISGDSNQILGNHLYDSAGTSDLIGIASGADNNYLSSNTFEAGTYALTINDGGANTIYATQLTASKILQSDSTVIVGNSTSVLTGSIDPTASTSVTGVSTLFLSELQVGDRITVTGETRRVTAIASNTSLTVDTAFTDNANDTSVDRLVALLVAKDSSNAAQVVVQDDGAVILANTLAVGTLGTANTNTYLCRNSSNQLATCSTAPLTNSLTDNVTDAFDLQEGTNNYININTTNSSENISFGNATTNPSFSFLGSGTATIAGLLRAGTGGTNGTATGAGDLYVQDALEVDGGAAITGPSGGSSVALNVNTGATTNSGLIINGASSQTAVFFGIKGFGESYNSFEVRNDGETVIRPVTGGDGSALRVMSADGTNTPFAVDTSTGLTSTYSQDISGSVTLSGSINFTGSSSTNFTTPQGATVTTRINIPLYDPGSANQLLAMGLPSGAATNSRAISLFDNRAAGDNQPVLSVFSPDESDVFGLSSDGSNSYGYLKATAGLGLGIKSGTTVAALFETSGNTTLNYDLAVNGGDITSTGNLTVNATGYTRIGDTGTPTVASGDDDLYVEGDLETDGTLVLGANTSASAWGLNGIQLQAGAATYTDSSTAGAGTATNAVFNSFATPILAATNSSITTTNAATVYIQGAPTAGTNQTITNPYAFWVDGGLTRLDGNLVIGDAEMGNAGFLAEFQGTTTASISVTAGDASSSSVIYLGTEGNETGQGALAYDNNTDIYYITANGGSGTITLDANSTFTVGTAAATGELRLADGSSNYVTFNVNALAGDYTLSVPTITANDTLCLVTLGNCAGAGREFTAVVGTSVDSSNISAAGYVANGNTGSAGDGDQIEINSAITAVNAAGGGTVFLLEGTYTIDATIAIKSNVQLVGSGVGATVIVVASGLDPTMSVISESTDPDNFAIKDLSINANASNQSSGAIGGIALLGTGSDSGATSAKGGLIQNIEIRDTSDNGIYLDDADLVTIADNHIFEGTTYGMWIDSGDVDRAVIIRNNNVHDMGNGGISVQNSEGVVVSGNTTNNNGGYGIEVDSTDGGTITGNTANNNVDGIVTYGGQLTITGNSTFGNSGAGISVNEAGWTTVTGNVVGGTTGTAGIELNELYYSNVSSNTIYNSTNEAILMTGAGGNVQNSITGNKISSTGGIAIQLNSLASDTSILGNNIDVVGEDGIDTNGADETLISGNSITTVGTSVGASSSILVSGDSNNSTIVGNKIRDAAGTGYAIDIAAAADNTYLADNTYGGTGATSIRDLGTNTRFANQISAASVLQSNSMAVTSIANTILTGSIDPAASASVTGVSTLFTRELQVGDKITVTGETRTVVTITSDTTLTVDTAFSNNANDTSVDRIPAGLTVKTTDSSANTLYIADSSNATVLNISTANSGSSNNSMVFRGIGVFGNSGEVDVAYNGGAEIRIGNNFYGDDYWTGGTGGYTYTFTPLAYTTGSASAFAGLTMTQNFAPTSGTNVYSGIASTPTINQTGTAAGITRGMYVNPTLTAFNDFRGLEVNATSTYTTANNQQGGQITVTDTGNVSSGTDTTLGASIDVTRTGASGGTINNTGLNISLTGDTGGTSTNTGLNVSVAGADTNYAAIFQGGNVGIGDTSPAALLTVGTSDAFQVDSSGNTQTSGTLTVSSTATFNGNTVIGNANTDTLTINAGTSGTGITFADASFFSCTALETSASGVLTCGSDAGGTPTLQNAYEGGNTILAVDAEGDIDLTVSEATNFSVDVTGTGSFLVQDGGVNILSINSSGNTTFNPTGGNYDFSIQGDTDADLFEVDASTDRIGIGDATPAALLTVGSGDLFQVNTSGDVTTAAGENLSVTTGTTGTLTLDTGTTGSISLGTGANAKTITIGNTTGATALNLLTGTGNFSLDGVAGTTYTLGASTNTGTIAIGGTAQTGNITLGSSSGTNSVLIGNGAGATTVNIANANTAGAVNIGSAFTTGTISIGGTGAQTGTINLGTGTGAQSINLGTGGTGAKTLTVGSTASTGVTTIQAGTGGVLVKPANGTTAFQVQNASSASLFAVDTTNGGNITLLGNTGSNSNGEPAAWITNTALSTARDNVSAVYANGHIYVPTGENGSSLHTNVAYAKVGADGTLGAWATTGTSMPTRDYAATATANGYIYILGGTTVFANTDSTATVHYAKINADGTVGTFAATSSLPAARKLGTATVLNGYMYYVGGSDAAGTTPNPIDDIYYAKINADGTLGTWASVTNATGGLPAARHSIGVGTANGFIYAIGGATGSATAQTTVYYARPATNGDITSAFTSDADVLPAARFSNGVYVANGYVYSAGGASGSTRFADVNYAPLALDGSIGTWSTQNASNDLPGNKMTFAYTQANGYFYAIGGYDGSALTTVYSTSVSRIRIGGHLDLVGLGGENLYDPAGSGSLTAGNTQIIGMLQVQGPAAFNGDLSVNGNITGALNLALGTPAQAGTILLSDGSSSTITFKTATQAAATNYDLTVPAITANDTFCLVTLANCAGAGREFTAVVGTSSSAGGNASSNVSAAGYVADGDGGGAGNGDQIEINSAITAVNAAGGGTVYLLEGTYVIDATITLLDNVKIIGAGQDATVIQLRSSHNSTVGIFTAGSGVEDWEIRDLSINGNDAGQSSGTYYGVTVTGAGGAANKGGTINNVEFYNLEDTSSVGVTMDTVVNIQITNSFFHDVYYGVYGLASGTSVNMDISNNKFIGVTYAGVALQNITEVTIEGNSFIISSSANSSITLNSATGLTISSNSFGGYDSAPGVVGQNTGVIDVAITGNSFEQQSASGVQGIFSNSLITGNSFNEIGNDQATNYPAIRVTSTTNTTISGNSIYSPTGDGIQLDSASGSNLYNTITGNTIEGADNGIMLETGSDYNVISSNTVFDNNNVGISLNVSDNNIISDNIVHDNGNNGADDGIALVGDSNDNQLIGNRITDTGSGTGQAIDISATSDNTYLADNTYSGTGAATITDAGTATVYANQYSSATNLAVSTANTHTINIGGAAQTGTITLGSSSGTQSVLIGNGAGASTVSIANATVAGATVNIAGGANTSASTISIANGATAAATTVSILSGVGTASTATLNLGNNTRVTQIDIGNIAAAAARTINLGTGSNTVGIDTINIGTGNTTVAGGKTINIGTGTPSGSGSNLVSIGSTALASSLLLQSGTAGIGLNVSGTQQAIFAGSNTLYLGNASTSGTAAAPNAFTVQATGSSTAATAGAALSVIGGTGNTSGLGGAITVRAGTGGATAAGGVLTLQGGSAGATSGNGGNVALVGGTSTTGVKGLVLADTFALSTAGTQNCTGTPCAITQANVDSYGAILITTNTSGYTVTLGDPTLGASATGRLIYVTNADATDDFVLSANGGSEQINLKPNTTATMIWNGTDWTAAGASSSTDLQAAYDNTAATAGGAEVVLSNSGTKGLTIRNDATTAIVGGLLEVQSSIGSNLFTVNNNAVEYANNGGAESATFTMWTAAPTAGGTIAQYTTAGDNIATGAASVSVDSTSTANTGVRNTLNATLTRNLKYRVSFAIRHTSSSTPFTTLDVRYSPTGTVTDQEDCSTANTVNYAQWTRITCTFTYDNATTPNSSNAILITHSDAVDHDYYIDNLSVTVSADVNHAIDGSVDVALGTNWQAIGGSVARSTSVLYDTSGSVQVTTSGTAGRGVYNNLTSGIIPQVSTQYRVAFYARGDGTNTATLAVAYTPDNNSTSVSCSDYNTQVVSATAYTLVTCLLTTSATTPVTSQQLRITQSAGSATTFYVDALTMTLNTNNSNNVQIGGANKGGPVTLFTLDRSIGAPIAANNDAYLGSMYYDTSSGRIQCYEADGWGACGAAPDNIVNLNPEYSGAVLNGSGVGTMTADFCSNQSGVLDVNTGLCSTGQAKNFYRWTSPQATQQTYSIYVTYQLPATFNGFSSDDTVQLTARVDNTTNASVTYEMFKSTGSAVTQCGTGETNIITGGGGSANTWYSYGINGNEATGCSFNSSSASNFVIFKINMKANSNANAYVSTLSFTTTGR